MTRKLAYWEKGPLSQWKSIPVNLHEVEIEAIREAIVESKLPLMPAGLIRIAVIDYVERVLKRKMGE